MEERISQCRTPCSFYEAALGKILVASIQSFSVSGDAGYFARFQTTSAVPPVDAAGTAYVN